jgi:hypothetical protein
MHFSRRIASVFVAAIAAAALTWSVSTLAADSVSRGAALKRVAYLYRVTEYCGLDSAEVHDGYRRQMRDLTRRGGLSESTVRWLRIRGAVAADLEYGDRGLGGFRGWCRTEGIEAARHFLAFRAAQMAAETDRPQP